MAAGPINITIATGVGSATIQATYWSSDGTPTGNLTPLFSDPNGVVAAAMAAALAAGTPLLASEAHIGSIGGTTLRPSSTFTRPANTTAYASGQLIANSATAASVAPLSFAAGRKNGGTGQVLGVTIAKTGAAAAPISVPLRLHLFTTAPVVNNGDGAAWQPQDATTYLDSIDVPFGTAAKAFVNGTSVYGYSCRAQAAIAYACAAGANLLYGLLEARGAYTPASGETFLVTLEASAD